MEAGDNVTGWVQAIALPNPRQTFPMSPFEHCFVDRLYPSAPRRIEPAAELLKVTWLAPELPGRAPICPIFSPFGAMTSRRTEFPLISPLTDTLSTQG